jgi:hypothetical protein
MVSQGAEWCHRGQLCRQLCRDTVNCAVWFSLRPPPRPQADSLRMILCPLRGTDLGSSSRIGGERRLLQALVNFVKYANRRFAGSPRPRPKRADERDVPLAAIEPEHITSFEPGQGLALKIAKSLSKAQVDSAHSQITHRHR